MQVSATHQVPLPRLQNVVATFEMGNKINLPQLVLMCPFVHYSPKRFAACVLRLKDPKTTCLVFASGKAVCTGATTEQFAQMASLKFVMLLQKHGADVQFSNFKVQNIVSAAHCNFRVDLYQLADTVNGFCSYEPALFPGLMYRVQVPAELKAKPNLIVFIVFQSGKCVITGGKNRKQIVGAWNKFYSEILSKYSTHMNHGNSGNYRMCQLSQKKHKDLNQIRAIANMSCDVPSCQLLYHSCKVESKAWPGHEWDLTDACAANLMQRLEPELYINNLRSSTTKPMEHYFSAQYQSQLNILRSVENVQVQEVLSDHCASCTPLSKQAQTQLWNRAQGACPVNPFKKARKK